MRCSSGTPPRRHKASCKPSESASNVSVKQRLTDSQFEYVSTKWYAKCSNGTPAIVTPSERMSVKSDWLCSPGWWACAKYTSRSSPRSARQSRNRRCSVRSCPAWNRPRYRRPSSSNTVFACSPLSRSSSSSTSGHTSSNGSARVRHTCATRSSLATFPERRYLRAVRSLIPAFAAAVTSGNPCLIVTTHPYYQWHARRERSEWPPAGCNPGSPWTADSLRCGNRLGRTCGCGSTPRLSA